MKRLNKIKNESDEDVTKSQNNKNNTVSPYFNGNGNGNGLTEKQQVAEEKAAATLFPLSLISNKFINPEPDTLKGKNNRKNKEVNVSMYCFCINDSFHFALLNFF